jgi:hypothetical protein
MSSALWFPKRVRHSRLHPSQTIRPDVVLLDLNYSLVANSAETMRQRRYDRELYRGWLVDLLRESRARVVLVTVRPARWERATVARIGKLLDGWQPDEAHFNDRGWSAPAWKAHVLRERVRPRFPSGSFLAIENNANVHTVYDREHVPWVKIDPSDRWAALPLWTTVQPRLFG